MKVPAAAQAFADSLPATDRFAFIVGYTLGRTGQLPPAVSLDELRLKLGLKTVALYCEVCRRRFDRSGKQGRPPKRCPDCRGVRS